MHKEWNVKVMVAHQGGISWNALTEKWHLPDKNAGQRKQTC